MATTPALARSNVTAMEPSDSGTGRLVKCFMEQVEQHHWMLGAFTK